MVSIKSTFNFSETNDDNKTEGTEEGAVEKKKKAIEKTNSHSLQISHKRAEAPQIGKIKVRQKDNFKFFKQN